MGLPVNETNSKSIVFKVIHSDSEHAAFQGYSTYFSGQVGPTLTEIGPGAGYVPLQSLIKYTSAGYMNKNMDRVKI